MLRYLLHRLVVPPWHLLIFLLNQKGGERLAGRY